VTYVSNTDLWDLSPDGFLLVDQHGVVCATNKALLEMFDISEADRLIGMAADTLLPGVLAHDHFPQSESRTAGTSRSLLARSAGGHVFPVTVSLTPLRIEGDLFMVMAVRDLTDRLESLKALGEATQRRDKAEDSERIATELHDNVVQRLFALGLDLQQLTPLIDDGVSQTRLSDAVDTVDQTIRTIRATILELSSAPASAEQLL